LCVFIVMFRVSSVTADYETKKQVVLAQKRWVSRMDMSNLEFAKFKFKTLNLNLRPKTFLILWGHFGFFLKNRPNEEHFECQHGSLLQ
jgi:hypothetical protein